MLSFFHILMILKKNTHTFKCHPFCAKSNLLNRKHISYGNGEYWNVFRISLFFNIIGCGILKSFALQKPQQPLYLSIVGRLNLPERTFQKATLNKYPFCLSINVFMNFEYEWIKMHKYLGKFRKEQCIYFKRSKDCGYSQNTS